MLSPKIRGHECLYRVKEFSTVNIFSRFRYKMWSPKSLDMNVSVELRNL